MFCFHQRTTTPRRDTQGTYIRCLDCTKRIPWKFEGKKLKPPRLTAPVNKEIKELERMIK